MTFLDLKISWGLNDGTKGEKLAFFGFNADTKDEL
jgi:hypothetical protein